jgi:hypothetical protein
MRSPSMASRAGLFALALVPLVMTHLCCGVTPVLPQVPVPEPDTARQEPPPDSSEVVDSPDIYGSLGLNLAVAFPFGEFSRNVSAGWGLTGDFSLRLVPSGWLGLRIDGGVIWYGHETIHDLVYLSRVPIDIETTTENYVVQGALGPQLHFAGHPMSARVYGLVGMSLFETRSSAKFDTEDSDLPTIELGSHGHLSDWTPSLTIGGEVRWVFAGSRDGFLAGLGLNVEWRRHGTTRYLVEGSITEVNGRPVFEPLESRIDFLLISIGLWGGTW